MTAAVLTERGCSYHLSAWWRLCAPLETQIGSFPGDLVGGRLAVWFILLKSTYNFTAVGGRPNPEHKTLGDIGATHIISPAGYQDNGKPLGADNWDLTEDASTSRSHIMFRPGTEPLILATAQLLNVAGVATCRYNSTDPANEVIDISGFVEGVIPVVEINERIRLNTSVLTVVS
jgi:hypothetical protein